MKVQKKEQEKNEKIERKNKKEKKIIIVVGIIILILFLLFIMIRVMLNNSGNDVDKIAQKISNELKKDYSNSSVKIVTKEEDTNFKYSYKYSALIYIGDSIKKEEEFAIAISSYNSNAEAKAKVAFIDSYHKLAHEKFDNTIMNLSKDYYESYFITEKNIILVKGKYLFSINSEIKNVDKIKNKIEEIIGKYNIEDNVNGKVNEDNLEEYWNTTLETYKIHLENTYNTRVKTKKKEILTYMNKLEGCAGNVCDEILSKVTEFEKYTELSEEINSVKNKYNEIMKNKEDTVNSINSSISSVKRSLNQEEYDSIKNRISELEDSYYDQYKEDWNNQLKSVEENVYKKSCGGYSYKDLLRNPSEYRGKKAYFFGKVLQTIGSYNYRVGIDCKKYQYIDGYSCDNTIYVTYFGDTRLIEDDMVEMWGTMSGTETYTTVLGSSVTLPKFSAQYINIK